MHDHRIIFTGKQYAPYREFWRNSFLPLNDPFKLTGQESVKADSKRGFYQFALEQTQQQIIDKFTQGKSMELFITLTFGYFILFSKYSGNKGIAIDTPLLKQGKLNHIFEPKVTLISNPDYEKTIKQGIIETSQIVSLSYKYQNFPLSLVCSKEKESAWTNISVFWDEIHHAPDEKLLNYDLCIEIKRENNFINFLINYDTGTFSENFFSNMAKHFNNLLLGFQDFNAHLKSLSLITEKEKLQILNEFNDPKALFPDKTIIELFEEQVQKHPNNTAVIFEDKRLTYKELNQKANYLAHYLRDKYNLKPDDFVGLTLEKSHNMIASILGILKSGAAYLPINPENPLTRIHHILNDSQTPVVLTSEKIAKNREFGFFHEKDSSDLKPCLIDSGARIEDLDALPIPDRGLVNYLKYNKHIQHAMVKNCATVQGTRGCPFNCAYCHKIWTKRHIIRSAEHIFNEIKMLYNAGFRRFAFIDDIFNLNVKNSTRFFKLIIENNLNIQIFFPNGVRGDILTKDYIDLMIEAGTVSIAFALETGSPRLQKFIGKNLKLDKLKENLKYTTEKYPHVITELFTMHGFPTETKDEANMTIDFINDIKWLDFPYVHMVHIYPNTDMYNLAIANGITDEAIEMSKSLYFHEIPETLPFDKSFSRQYQARFMNEYFLSKERLLKVLPTQMKILTQDELLQKYDAYLPIDIHTFDDLLDFVGITKQEIGEIEFYEDQDDLDPDFTDYDTLYSKNRKYSDNALKVLLLDLSQFFSHDSSMIDNLIEPPLGMMYLLTSLNETFGEQINGKIAKSRIDFDSFDELKSMVLSFQPDIIGVRALTIYKDFFHKTISMLKQWGVDTPIIAGGPYATSSYKTVLQDRNIDIVVMGEGEKTFCDLMGKIIDNRGKLPTDNDLETIDGIAFVKQEDKVAKHFNRDVIFIENLLDDNTLQYSLENPEHVNKPDDLAYLLYTSGSTGEPKGCMISHKNVVRLMTNDKFLFDFTSKDVWIMAHAFYFDFSVWEMYGPLLYGGLLIVPNKEDIRDTDKFLSLIKKHKVTVLNQTPAAFNNLVKLELENESSHLDDHIKYIIFGGEKFEPSYAKEWIKRYALDKIQLINMYGITETTVHVTFYKVTEQDVLYSKGKSIVGRPLPETVVYVCDSCMNLLPIGTAGEMYVGGTGLARGYLNRPNLTSERFIQSPFKDTKRLYKTGDLGRWLPGGVLEYLGRNDDQVQVRGYRVELGEIEAGLLNHPKISQAIVIPKDSGDNYVELIAYVVTQDKFNIMETRSHLDKYIPDYMIPSWFVPLDKFPLNHNGKIDRKALPAPYTSNVDLGTDYEPPRNENENKLVKVWESVLGRKQIGINDNYFALGGDSIKAIQVISRLHQENLKLEIRNIFQYQTIAELADYVVDIERIIDQNPVKGTLPLTPVQTWFFKTHKANPYYFNQSEMLYFENRFDENGLKAVFKELINHHDALRMSFNSLDSYVVQENEDIYTNDFDLQIFDLRQNPNAIEALLENANKIQNSIQLDKGPMLKAALFQMDDGDRLLIVIHHLVIDGVSWRILSEDITLGYNQYLDKQAINFPLKTDSFKIWAQNIKEYSNSSELLEEKRFWQTIESMDIKPLPIDFETKEQSCYKDIQKYTLFLSSLDTENLLTNVNEAYNTEVNDILLTALAKAISTWKQDSKILITLEGHGREDIIKDIDISRTVGWFTSIYPVVLEVPEIRQELDYQIKYIKETLRKIPNKGIGYGILKYITSNENKNDLLFNLMPQISFNYLGQFDADITDMFKIAKESSGNIVSDNCEIIHDIDINAIIMNKQLEISILYNSKKYKADTIENIANQFKDELLSIIEHCMNVEDSEITPSDIDYDGLDIDELDDILNTL